MIIFPYFVDAYCNMRGRPSFVKDEGRPEDNASFHHEKLLEISFYDHCCNIEHTFRFKKDETHSRVLIRVQWRERRA